MGEDIIYYRATMNWRTTSTLVAGAFLSIIGGALFAWLMVQIIPEVIHQPKYILVAIFPLFIGGAFVWGGLGNLQYYFSAKTADLIVGEDGVSYGEQRFPWCEIGALFAYRYRGKLQLLLHRRGRIALDRHLESNEGISESAYRALIQTLRLRVSPNFPHVHF